MWIVRDANPFGRLSIRKLLLFVAAILAASFAYIFLAAPVTHAEDANWNGDSLMYNQQQYIKQADTTSGDSRGFPAGTHVYSYTEEKKSDDTPQKIHFIYFSPSTDPTKATSASYVTYDYMPPDKFKNPTDKKTISLQVKTADDSKTTSCVVQGIGWIVCPVTNFFASAMDWLFGVLSGFLTVRPVQTDQANALYRAWSYMRNFANVVFVVAFLIIIYSQVSSIGISNYGIKKILPRLVIAAVLVNISYWICAIAIDVSNILGYSIQDIFISMRNAIVGGEGNSWNVTSWNSVTGFVLSGGTALTALGIGTYSALAGAGGAIYLLLPILLGVLLSVLVALLVLAARQAIITILVIISPLAFVAYILPNTEKYFKRWHELGITLLVMFPAFSVVFGGSQLAGTAIIQNADSINLIILGMAVQVAPLAITPLLMRVSGSLLTKVAGLVNNPKRGMMDRTRNWSQQRADEHKARMLAHPATRRRDFLARSAQSIDNRNRKREGWKKVNEAIADNRWHQNHDHEAIDTASREAERTKQILEQQHNADWNVRARIDPNSKEQELRLRVAADQESLSKARLDVMHQDFKTYRYDPNDPTSMQSLPDYVRNSPSMLDTLNASNDTTRDIALTAMREQAAKRKQSQQLTQDLLKNTDTVDGSLLRDYAGGVMGTVGAEGVLTDAVASYRKEYNENVQNKKQLIKHFNLSGDDRQNLAMGKSIAVSTDSNGNTYQFNVSDGFAREAAIETQLSGAGNVKQIEQIIASSGSALAPYKTTISNSIVEFKLPDKSSYLSGRTIDDVAQGNIKTDADLDAVATRALAQGKIKPSHLATMDKDAVDRVWHIAFRPNLASNLLSDQDRVDYHTQVQELVKSAQTALTSPSLKGSVAQNVEPILQAIINGTAPPPKP